MPGIALITYGMFDVVEDGDGSYAVEENGREITRGLTYTQADDYAAQLSREWDSYQDEEV